MADFESVSRDDVPLSCFAILGKKLIDEGHYELLEGLILHELLVELPHLTSVMIPSATFLEQDLSGNL
jgi:uncharacterized membrane protein